MSNEIEWSKTLARQYEEFMRSEGRFRSEAACSYAFDFCERVLRGSCKNAMLESNASSFLPELVLAQYTAIGLYLVFSGIFSGVLHLLGIASFFLNQSLWNPSSIPELGLTFADLCVACLHPFSGTSALMNEWVWGVAGCHLYATEGLLFGNFQMLTVAFIAFDRYVLICRPDLGTSRSVRHYLKLLIWLFIYSLCWSLAPVLGWGRYGQTKLGVTCTIDWMETGISYATFIITYSIFVYVIPLCFAAYFHYQVFATIRRESITVEWSPNGWEGTIILGSLLSTYLAFSGYAVVCTYTIFFDPATLIQAAHALPPLLAKTAGIFNAIFYILLNWRHRQMIKKLMGCSFDRAVLETGTGIESVPLRSMAGYVYSPPPGGRESKSGSLLAAFRPVFLTKSPRFIDETARSEITVDSGRMFSARLSVKHVMI